ncbi:MAG: hypothetical protein ACRCZS_03925, partial [Chroococcidiopsis sp.]
PALANWRGGLLRCSNWRANSICLLQALALHNVSLALLHYVSMVALHYVAKLKTVLRKNFNR